MADGQPIIIGQANPNMGQTRTTLSTNAPDVAFDVTNSLGVPAPTAIFGQCQEGTGVRGLSGVLSPVPAVTPELRAGVFGTSIDRVGVVGESEVNVGVRGDSTSGPGVRGESKNRNGVEGISGSSSASGVYGQNDSGGFGVAGRTLGPAPAVFGDNTGTGNGMTGNSPNRNGVEGISGSSSASGVYGQNDSGGFGVAGRTLGPAPAVFGDNTGTGDGVQGHSRDGTGVVGQSFSTAVPIDAFDIRSAGVSGIGPPVTATSLGVGGTGSPGVLGRPAPGNPVGNGVEGRSLRGWAGIFRGNVFVSGNVTVVGTKSAAVPHPDGSTRQLYAIESPDNWFEDFGRAELKEGHARVEIDPDFAALVKTEDDYHVFLTPEGESAGLFVSNRTVSSFEVREQQQGTGSITFSYRIVARRKDVDTERLRKVDLPPPIPEEEMLK